MATFLLLLSGLFLGWSLGANDAANIFGTAVMTRMVRFRFAALLCSVFVIVGALQGGKGASATLGNFASISFLPAAFTVALACALTLFAMTRLKLPVSSSQAIIGALIGWNLFAGHPINLTSLGTIASTWVFSPILAAGSAILLYLFFKFIQKRTTIRLATSDLLLRWGLILAGIFGAYSLGVNNIANVVGIFIRSNPFPPITLGFLRFSALDLLFLAGGIAIALGVITYSKNVMTTVGSDIFKLTPMTGFIVVCASALSLFLFGSPDLQHWLIRNGLPSFPLVPVSSSQAVVGAVLGIGMVRNITSINWRTLSRIGIGWVATPLLTAAVAFFLLFIMQNVFTQHVREKTIFLIKPVVREKCTPSIPAGQLASLDFKPFHSEQTFRDLLEKKGVSSSQIEILLKYARYTPIIIDHSVLHPLFGLTNLTDAQRKSIGSLSGHFFSYRWEMEFALSALGEEWRLKPDIETNKTHNTAVQDAYDFIFTAFSTPVHTDTL